jgi:hypothetical protein
MLAFLVLLANPVSSSDETMVPVRTPMHIKVSLHVVGTPRLEEPVTFVYTATPDIDVRKMELQFRCSEGTELVSGSGVTYTSCKKGETKAYKVTVRFVSSVSRVGVNAWICVKNEKGKEIRCPSGRASLDWYLVDEKTGLFGGLDEWLNHPSRRVLMLYNSLDCEWLSNATGWADGFYRANQKIVSNMRGYEPSLTDSQALCLHQDNYRLIILGIGDAGATDSARIVHLLGAGWLTAQRDSACVKERWLAGFMERNRGGWETELELNLRSGDSDEGMGEESSEEPGDTPVIKQLPAKVVMNLSDVARLNEEANVCLTVTPDVEIPNMKVRFALPMGAELVSGDTAVHTFAAKGDTKTYCIRIRFVSCPVIITASAGEWWKNDKGEEVYGFTKGTTKKLWFVDEDTGRLVSEREYRNSRIEFMYEPYGGWLEEGDPMLAEQNRKIISMLRSLEPALTDSEALCLHCDAFGYESPYRVMGPILPDAVVLNDELRLKYLLEKGWFAKNREGDVAKREWLRALSDEHARQRKSLKEGLEEKQIIGLWRRWRRGAWREYLKQTKVMY